jgi:hypothetical protein
MNTAKFIDWITSQTGTQKTPTQMLDYVNIAQNEIFSYNTYYNQVKPFASTLLATTDGILQYTLPNTSIRQVARVYYIDTYGKEIDVAMDSDESAEANDTVTVYFEENPGTTTDKFYYDAFTWPTNGQLTSTSIPLSVPERTQTGLLYYIVTRMLEEGMDGRSLYNDEKEGQKLKEWIGFANKGAKRQPNIPTPVGY